jgi:hypothetical protein
LFVELGAGAFAATLAAGSIFVGGVPFNSLTCSECGGARRGGGDAAAVLTGGGGAAFTPLEVAKAAL